MTPEKTSSYRALTVGAFITGLAVVLWVASGFVGTGVFALGMTLLIAAVYLTGAWELRRFTQTTTALNTALGQIPQPLTTLADWLPRVPVPLRNAVRQRIEAERSAFPGLALTPYLIGLLVMLGMLGTFLGMVVTFKGAVFALEGSADLNAIRAALAAPIKGLGLSFGTSVAGVATSAMLGLMATLVRRERTLALRRLDALLGSTFYAFTPAHQRQQNFEALQRQAEAMPAAAQHLQTLIERMEQRSQQLDTQLLERQQHFQREAVAAYTQLAQSVEQSLRDSLQPVVQQAMAGIAAESTRLHEGVNAAVQAQLEALSARFGATTATVADTWTRALAQHEQGGQQLLQGLSQSLAAFNTGFEDRSAQLLARVQATQTEAQAQRAQAEQQQHAALTAALERMAQDLKGQWQHAGEQTLAQQRAVLQALETTATTLTERSAEQAGRSLDGVARLIAQTEALVQARAASEETWTAQHGQRMDELAALWRSELQTLRADEAARGDAAVQRLADLQAALATQLATLGTALEAPMARLMQTASEAPKAAAEVIAQLREQMSRLAERHNANESATLSERAELMERIGGLLQQVQQTTGEQRAAIEHLVGSATDVLDRVGQQFADTVGAQAGRAEAMAEQATTSAAQLASLGEAFQQGTAQLATSHEQLVQSLQRVEGAIGESMARSDEQLAYYVAQAREVIDLSISAQQGIVEDLRQLRSSTRAAAGAA
ncbi:DUF802 domain-containing protein [Hydrogenophaga sp.]|uniref:DUF802 domain-containing protein n=1 Tax=Hydrogenophaga sp. TaxID=1904254 RepID=UPI0035B27382